MRLKRLETFGFKSFADRMSFDFEDGITAVIGPNGCGKSNIVDSIKWVIGEQSAKALRGDDMTDVIFNGCATRRPMSMCEVTLVMDEVGPHFGLEGNEVAITRRLFRDGTSSYYLNGKGCRLKDIKELFMDTGVGTSAYSVIEQGRVGFILESNTKDRRLILEEAAGISKYKARRRIALRKLERVELDLKRIGEVLGEVRRRAKAVARQAQAALRFKELSGRVRDLRLAFALEEFGRLGDELKSQTLRGEELSTAIGGIAAKLGGLEAGLVEADTKLVALEQDIRASEQSRADAQSRRDVARHKADDAKYRLVEIDHHEVEDRAQLDALAQRVQAIDGELAAAEHALQHADTGGADDTLAGAMRARREELDRAITSVDEVIREVETAKAKQVEALREISRIEAERSRMESSRQAMLERRKRLEERSGGHTEQLAHAAASEAAATQQVQELVIAAAAAHQKLDDGIRGREIALAEGNRLDNELNEIRHQEARAETALRLLQEQERRAEGVFRGVKDIIAQMDRFPGVVGMVADLVKVPDNCVVAIETALGGSAQHIVTETQDAARQAIDFLKRERRGRATFLPLDDIEGGERVPRDILNEPGVVGVASRLIETENRFRPAIEFLLGNVLIVENIDHAINLRRRRRPHCRIVTLEGDVIAPGGAMTGGRNQGHDGGGLVSRKAELARLGEQLQDLATRKIAIGQARDAAKKSAFELSIGVEETRRAISAADRSVGEAKARLMSAERDKMHLEEAASTWGSELEEIAAEMARLEAESRELAGQGEWFGTLERKLGQDIVVLQEQMEARGRNRDRLQDEVSNLRVSLATTQERVEAMRNQQAVLRRSRQEVEDQRLERSRRLAGHDSKREELGRAQAENESAFAAAAAEVETHAERLAGLIRERDAVREGSEGARQEARQLAGRQRGLEQERSACELKANEATVRLEGLCQRIRDEYQMELAEAHANYQRPEDVDWPALRGELNVCEEELARLGPVNLSAIDELEEVQGREQFLGRQHADLESAALKLHEIIEHINDVSRKLFDDTYKVVRKNFQELFRKLFGGGSADLKLERWEMVSEPDPNGGPPREVKKEVDILEAGLEIVAQPPGKNPKIITQLSGGEKALTAIALLFAVYQTKPSPFCILDEVDAPLDEANVDVYNSMLREFARDGQGNGSSQFIVITHKKRTMQRADAIYGITQNERGVSTKISVRFEEVGDLDGGLAPTVRGAGPYAG